MNSNKETVDVALEKRNFEHAGERLAGIFEEMVYDGHPTYANYVKPDIELEPNMQANEVIF